MQILLGHFGDHLHVVCISLQAINSRRKLPPRPCQIGNAVHLGGRSFSDLITKVQPKKLHLELIFQSKSGFLLLFFLAASVQIDISHLEYIGFGEIEFCTSLRIGWLAHSRNSVRLTRSFLFRLTTRWIFGSHQTPNANVGLVLMSLSSTHVVFTWIAATRNWIENVTNITTNNTRPTTIPAKTKRINWMERNGPIHSRPSQEYTFITTIINERQLNGVDIIHSSYLAYHRRTRKKNISHPTRIVINRKSIDTRSGMCVCECVCSVWNRLNVARAVKREKNSTSRWCFATLCGYRGIGLRS